MAASDPLLFVSHVSEDRAAALEIVNELERRGILCWIAPRDVTPGRPFDDEIVEAIENSRAILLIFSDLCNESEYIRREVTVAGESHKLIIPFRIEDAQPRRGLRVRLSDLHWLDGFAARERAIDEVAKRFAPALSIPRLHPTPAEMPAPGRPVQPGGTPPRASEAAPTETPRAGVPIAANPARSKHPTVFIGLAALAAAGIGATAWYWSLPDAKPPLPAVAVAADAVGKGKDAFDRGDYAASMQWHRQAADQGNAVAQTYVGFLFEKGLGIAADPAEASSWYRKAASQGHAPAQKNLGNLYEQGSGAPQDYAEALSWYRKAAEQGNAGAQTNIGYLYEKGLGVPQNYAEALSWYRKAAEQGETTAQSNIGVFYDRGYGVAQDYAEALRWYRKAAEQGNVEAQYNLALLYAEGHGVQRDLTQARQWMQKAAEAGDAEAKKWLGSHGG
jgi:TPR repeat protein